MTQRKDSTIQNHLKKHKIRKSLPPIRKFQRELAFHFTPSQPNARSRHSGPKHNLSYKPMHHKTAQFLENLRTCLLTNSRFKTCEKKRYKNKYNLRNQFLTITAVQKTHFCKKLHQIGTYFGRLLTRAALKKPRDDKVKLWRMMGKDSDIMHVPI